MDVQLFNEMGKEFFKLFANKEITKILTIESSGIGIACIAAQYFNVPVVFAKKTEAKNLDSDAYLSEVFSFTKGKTYTIRVSKNYITSKDTVLIIDDFLANGKAVLGLAEIISKAGAKLAGVGIAIEKGFQDGGKLLRESGIDVQSLAIVGNMQEGHISFMV
jgi:xanthine phosphoribosyltransferase